MLNRASSRSLLRKFPRQLPLAASFSTLNTPKRSSLAPFASPSIRARNMSATHGGESTLRPEPDKVLQDIADYVHNFQIDPTGLAMKTASLCLIDTIGCGLEALRFPECTKLLGPVVEGTVVPNGTFPGFLSSLNSPSNPHLAQAPKYPGPTISWTPSGAPST